MFSSLGGCGRTFAKKHSAISFMSCWTAALAGDVVWYGMAQYGLRCVDTGLFLVFLMLENMVQFFPSVKLEKTIVRIRKCQ